MNRDQLIYIPAAMADRWRQLPREQWGPLMERLIWHRVKYQSRARTRRLARAARG